MNAGLADYIAWWGPYAVALLAVVFSVVMKTTSKCTSEPETHNRGWWIPKLLAGVLVLTGALLIGILSRPVDQKWSFSIAFLAGGIFACLTGLYSRFRDDRVTSQSANALAGVGLALGLMAVLRNYYRDAPTLYLCLAGLGAWFTAAASGYGSMRCNAAQRAFSLAAAGIVGGVALGSLRYPTSGLGSLAVVDMLAIALLVSMAAMLFAGVGSRLRAFSCAAAPVAMLALLWWLGGLLGKHLLRDPDAGLCVLAGAATAMLAYMLAASASRNASRVLNVPECGALVVLVVSACLAASIRWLGAYGAALSGIGALAALPLLAVIHDRTRRSTEVPAMPPTAASVAVAAAFIAVALARIFLQIASSSRGVVDLFQVYTIPGLMVGGALVLIPGVIVSRNCSSTGHVSAFLRGLVSVIVVSLVTLAVAYLWRGYGAVGLVVGVAIGVLYTILASALWDTASASIDLAPGIQLFAVTVIPILMAATISATRAQKVTTMSWMIAALALVVIVSSVARALARRRIGEE